MNVSKIGLAVVIATLGAYAIAGLERRQALTEEEDRVSAELLAEPIGHMKEAMLRAEWEVGRKKAAFEEWQKAINTGTSADVEMANKHGERVDEEIKEQNKAWAAQDEKARDNREAAKKEQHRDALAAIERNFYTHFALAWLLIMGVLLALGQRYWRDERRGAKQDAAAYETRIRSEERHLNQLVALRDRAFQQV